ncbi:type I restriction enzyme HsdR N-terminal domain-containing protein [Algoriphagus jejuensis]|uniref:Type I restriction enzyme HsdR N-terminal domain-containing protein n=1 Tax=Algoriphagus jejuensis TaxID=419934 RepID=A0ABN1N0H0_9BACT
MNTQDQTINLPGLNLPHFQPELKRTDDKLWIFDSLRKKHLILTPEEWVRQHWINFLINHHDYPRGLFSLEKGLKYNQLTKRTDLIVFTREAKPYLLIECKAPSVKIDERTLNQAMVYNQNLECQYLVLTNGLVHIFLEYSENHKRFVQKKDLPSSPK